MNPTTSGLPAIAMVLALVLGLMIASTGCASDTECTSDRHCAEGQECVSAGGLFSSQGVCLSASDWNDITEPDAGDEDTFTPNPTDPDANTDQPPSCLSGETLCESGNYCADLTRDGLNCGSCSRVCGGNDVCYDSSCQAPPCPTGQVVCSRGCHDTNTSRFHCGGCNSRCDDGQTCVGGSCQ